MWEETEEDTRQASGLHTHTHVYVLPDIHVYIHTNMQYA